MLSNMVLFANSNIFEYFKVGKAVLESKEDSKGTPSPHFKEIWGECDLGEGHYTVRLGKMINFAVHYFHFFRVSFLFWHSYR